MSRLFFPADYYNKTRIRMYNHLAGFRKPTKSSDSSPITESEATSSLVGRGPLSVDRPHTHPGPDSGPVTGTETTL